MYPLIEIGPFNIGSGVMFALIAVTVGKMRWASIAKRRGGESLGAEVDRCFYPVFAGMLVGGRIAHAIFDWEQYVKTPELLWSPHIAGFDWIGALVGGSAVGYVWCVRGELRTRALADCAALALPIGLSIGSIGLLMSGEAFGIPTTAPWGIPLLGGWRQPTQVFYLLAAVITLAILKFAERRNDLPGSLAVMFAGLHGLSLLLIEPLRADSIVVSDGIRVNQVLGLALILGALFWARTNIRSSFSTGKSGGT